MEALKYPIGKLVVPETITETHLRTWIDQIAEFPTLLRQEVKDLTPDQLEWRYRPGGWCIRQVIHHCADSHLNSQARFKLALTEERPTIKPYLENKWAELADSNSPIEWSLDFLDALHRKWIFLLKNLSPADFEKDYFHPERNQYLTLKWTVALYAWHGRHHLGHLKLAKQSGGINP